MGVSILDAMPSHL